MDPVGLRRRVGLLLEGGEPMPSSGGRLIRVESSDPVKELAEGEEFNRKEKRSKRDPAGSVLWSPSSFGPTLMRSFKGPVSGSELVRKRERWALPFSKG